MYSYCNNVISNCLCVVSRASLSSHPLRYYVHVRVWPARLACVWGTPSERQSNLASFPGHSHCQYLIASCSIQNTESCPGQRFFFISSAMQAKLSCILQAIKYWPGNGLGWSSATYVGSGCSVAVSNLCMRVSTGFEVTLNASGVIL